MFCSGLLSVLSVGILPSLFQNNIADQWLAISCDRSLGCTRRKHETYPSSSKVRVRRVCVAVFNA